MNKRKQILFEGLFAKYQHLQEQQDLLYDGKVSLEEDKTEKLKELQSNKLLILSKMNDCFK